MKNVKIDLCDAQAITAALNLLKQPVLEQTLILCAADIARANATARILLANCTATAKRAERKAAIAAKTQKDAKNDPKK